MEIKEHINIKDLGGMCVPVTSALANTLIKLGIVYKIINIADMLFIKNTSHIPINTHVVIHYLSPGSIPYDCLQSFRPNNIFPSILPR